MNESLQRAIEKLPDIEQTIIADQILRDLSEREWDEIVSKPRVRKRLRELAEEALKDEAEDGGFGE
jgi:hypothetical protein